MQPKLTLVGAGPGDVDLITLKGIKALAAADVVLYDSLANGALLDYANPFAPTICVGKRAGQPSFSQDEINDLIVEMAHTYGHVVRLKGGDSFVFGRGYEEMAYARIHGLEVAVVPGISSSIGVPESVSIPVTSRGVSESFWVITGTTQTGELSNDIRLAAQSSATVVILMGMRKLADIMRLFETNGKGTTPVAVIQNGTTDLARYVLATVETIEEHVNTHFMGSPAVIVVGEVVALHPAYVRTYIEQLIV